MSRKYLRYYSQRALTLIEVLTALAILSTLLVGILIAFQENAQRIRAEGATRNAVSGVDRLLWNWAQQGVYAPSHAEGTLPGSNRLRWHTWVVSREHRKALDLDIVRLQVDVENGGGPSRVMMTIDLPVPAGAELPTEASGK